MSKFIILTSGIAKHRVNFDYVIRYVQCLGVGTLLIMAPQCKDGDLKEFIVSETPEEIDRLLKGE